MDGNTGTGIYNTGTLTLNGSSTITHNSEAGSTKTATSRLSGRP